MDSPKTLRRPRFYYGWVIVGVVALASFSQTAETFPVWGVLLKPMTEEFGWSRTAFSGAMSVGTLLGAVLAMVFGPLLDRFGPRWSVVVAFFIIGGTLLLMAGISSLWQFYALLVLGRAVHLGVVGIATSVIIPKWFIAMRGRAVAIGNLGNRVGSAVTPLYAQLLVTTASWRAAVATVGVVVWAASLLPAALFLRRRPEDLGLLPDGATPERLERARGQAPGAAGAPRRRLETSFTPRQVLRFSSFYLLTFAFTLGFAVGTTTSLHIMPYLTDQGLTAGVAVVVVAVSSATGAAGSLLFGFLAERLSVRWIMVANLLLLAISFALLQAVHSSFQAFLWGAFYGVAQGAVYTLFQVIFADYYGRESLGAIRGLVSPVQSLAQAVGPVGAAIAYDTGGSYSPVFLLFSLLSLASALCVALARPPALPSPVVSTASGRRLPGPEAR